MPSNEAKIYAALLIAAAILGLILVFFIVTLIKQQRAKNKLHQQKINAEIITLENERKRLARDLHDEIAMVLSVAKLEISGVKNLQHDDRKILEKATGHIDDGLKKIREIIKDIMPAILERRGFFAALEEFFVLISEVNKIYIDYSFDNRRDLPEYMQIHVYRIVQEIVHNCLKHARATKIIFRLEQTESLIKIMMRDNGKGFNQENIIKYSAGMGLHNILSRVEMLNGEIFLETSEGSGVNYIIEIPILE